MITLQVRNVQEAYYHGLTTLRARGEWEDTRNGRALVLPYPLCTMYEKPWERVLLDPKRDANPFFHLMESFWMLSGSNDTASIGKFISTLSQFSDDGKTFHGAYGHRWQKHFGKYDIAEDFYPTNQLTQIISLLRSDPTTRRAVLSMWDPVADLGRDGKDFPCNTQLYLRNRTGELDLTILCRSNDAIWGAYGANAVHFSILHEFLSLATGLKQGRLYQWSNNFHAYESVLDKVGIPAPTDTYAANRTASSPLFSTKIASISPDLLMTELRKLWQYLQDPTGMFISPLLTPSGFQTAVKMAQTSLTYKELPATANEIAYTIPHEDWRIAAQEWLARRSPKSKEIRRPCNVY